MKTIIITFLLLILSGSAFAAADDYDLVKDKAGNLLCIHRKRDNAGIPKEEDNIDYQAFKTWNAARTPPLVVPEPAPDSPEISQRKNDLATLKAFLELDDDKVTAAQLSAALKAFIRVALPGN